MRHPLLTRQSTNVTAHIGLKRHRVKAWSRFDQTSSTPLRGLHFSKRR